jgi:hypothetical protein
MVYKEFSKILLPNLDSVVQGNLVEPQTGDKKHCPIRAKSFFQDKALVSTVYITEPDSLAFFRRIWHND